MDSLAATDGTTMNWRMMGTVIEQVHNLENIVEENGAGDFDEGVIFVPIMHTLNWTNSLNEQKHLVINNNLCVITSYYLTI